MFKIEGECRGSSFPRFLGWGQRFFRVWGSGCGHLFLGPLNHESCHTHLQRLEAVPLGHVNLFEAVDNLCEWILLCRLQGEPKLKLLVIYETDRRRRNPASTPPPPRVSDRKRRPRSNQQWGDGKTGISIKPFLGDFAHKAHPGLEIWEDY